MPSTIFLATATCILLAPFAHAAATTAVAPWVLYHITQAEYELIHRVVLAHGIILGLAFAFMYPFGATLIRALSFKGVLWFHAWWQVVAYILSLVGLGTGIWLVIHQHNLLTKTYHPIIGLIVIGLLTLMPPLGYMHHVLFVKKGRRTPITYIHRWLGRFAIILGGINGGLGIWTAHNQPFWGIIAYTAVAAFFYSQWFSIVGLLELIKRRKVVEDAAKAGGSLEEEEHNIDTETSSQDDKAFVEAVREMRVKM